MSFLPRSTKPRRSHKEPRLIKRRAMSKARAAWIKLAYGCVAAAVCVMAVNRAGEGWARSNESMAALAHRQIEAVGRSDFSTPSAAERAAIAKLASLGCAPWAGLKKEAQNLGPDLARDPKAPMAIAVAGKCPDGIRYALAYQGQGQGGSTSVHPLLYSAPEWIKLDENQTVSLRAIDPDSHEFSTTVWMPLH